MKDQQRVDLPHCTTLPPSGNCGCECVRKYMLHDGRNCFHGLFGRDATISHCSNGGVLSMRHHRLLVEWHTVLTWNPLLFFSLRDWVLMELYTNLYSNLHH